MTIWMVSNWSVLPGDSAYVEADTPDAARDALAVELQRIDSCYPDDRPREEWQVVEASRPLCVVCLRD